MESEKQKPVLSVRIDAELLRRLDALVEGADVGRAEIVERCITVGLENQEELVSWIKSPIKGPVVQWLTHPAVMRALGKFFNEQPLPDATSAKLRQKAINERKGLKGKPAKA